MLVEVAILCERNGCSNVYEAGDKQEEAASGKQRAGGGRIGDFILGH